MLAMGNASNGDCIGLKYVTMFTLCRSCLPGIFSVNLLCLGRNGLSPVSCETESCSVDSTVPGTIFPGFLVVSLTPMCPLKVGFFLVLVYSLPFQTPGKRPRPVCSEIAKEASLTCQHSFCLLCWWEGGLFVLPWSMCGCQGGLYGHLITSCLSSPHCDKCKGRGERVHL